MYCVFQSHLVLVNLTVGLITIEDMVCPATNMLHYLKFGKSICISFDALMFAVHSCVLCKLNSQSRLCFPPQVSGNWRKSGAGADTQTLEEQ